ncbi:MAG: hypothetical protein V4646_12815, partial [Pseudomonadota bacterium]
FRGENCSFYLFEGMGSFSLYVVLNRVSGIDGHPHRTQSENTQDALKCKRSVGAQDRYFFVTPDAKLHHPAGDTLRRLLYFVEGQCPSVIYQAWPIRIEGNTAIKEFDDAHSVVL